MSGTRKDPPPLVDDKECIGLAGSRDQARARMLLMPPMPPVVSLDSTDYGALVLESCHAD